MINLQMFDTEEDLMKLTGLSHDELWDNDFDLDDWDVGFVSDVPLTTTEYYDDLMTTTTVHTRTQLTAHGGWCIGWKSIAWDTHTLSLRAGTTTWCITPDGRRRA